MRGALAWLAAALLAACLQSPAQVCADGRICPAGTRCDDLHDRCVLPEQLTECVDADDGTACEIAGAPFGVCRDEVCLRELCGDEFISGAEECEDADLGGASCVDLGYYYEPGLGCTDACTFDTTECLGYCGDGGADHPHELCDGGPPLGGCPALGYDIGAVGCSGFCGPDVSGCQRFVWDPLDSPHGQTFAGMWKSPAGALWMVGNGAWRYDGDWIDYTPPGTPDLNDIWGTSEVDLFAVGAAGTILRHDANGWTAMTSPTTEELTAVTGTGPADVYAVGRAGTVVHFDGTDWTAVASGATGDLWDVWASGPDDVFVVGGLFNGMAEVRHFDGAWSPMTLPPGTSGPGGVWGTGPNDVFAVGSGGQILHYDGGAWSAMPNAATGLLSRVDGSGPSDVWVVGQFETLHYDGTRWTMLDPPPDVFFGLAVVGPGEVIGAGNGTVARHRDTAAVTATHGLAQLYAIAGTAPDDVFGVSGSNLVAHWDGQAWQTTDVGSAVNAIWAVAPDDVYASGGGTLLHFDGNAWSGAATPGGQLYALWAADATHVFAVGSDGRVFEACLSGCHPSLPPVVPG